MATVTATFYDRDATEQAVDDLAALGIPRGDISVVMSDDTRNREYGGDTDVRGANVAKGAAGGGVVGGSLGAIVGGLLLGGTISVATGGAALPFLVAGPIAGALAGGGAGAAVGSVIGALVGAGVPEGEARAIESDVNNGGVILAVRTDDANVSQVEAVLRRDGGGVAPGSARNVPTYRGETDETVARPADAPIATGTPLASDDPVVAEAAIAPEAVAPIERTGDLR